MKKEMLAIPDRIAVQLVRHIPALLANVDAGNDTRLADAMRITSKNIAQIRKKTNHINLTFIRVRHEEGQFHLL